MKIIYKTRVTASGDAPAGHANPMQLVMPPFTQVEPAIGMALYSTRAILHGRGGDVWEMVKENFL
jgi:pyruvate dehydrogenase (quinone)